MAEAKRAALVVKYGLTEAELAQKCSDDHMLDIGEFISWQNVGPHLPDISKDDVKDIDKDGFGQTDRRRRLMGLWEERNGDDATYDAMITAMTKARKNDEAEKVCKLLSPQGVASAAPPPRQPAATAAHPGGPKAARGETLADSPGLAILVTCDYESTKNLGTLTGTRKDAEEMKITFDYLSYVIHQLYNPTKADVQALLHEISDHLKNNPVDKKAAAKKVIIFAFSGHGCNVDNTEKVYTNDGETVDLMDEIVYPLTKHDGVFHVPKLFFIDACRGAMQLFSKGAGATDDDQSAKSDEVYFEKGVQHVEGNYRIDYSTIPQHVSYVGTGGSMWMPKLAQALREQNDSFQNIADNVKRDVHDRLGDKKQQCESVNRLNTGALYLQKRLEE